LLCRMVVPCQYRPSTAAFDTAAITHLAEYQQ
jgi:hypothetical protein